MNVRLKIIYPLAAITFVVLGIITPLLLLFAMENGLCIGVGVVLTIFCIVVSVIIAPHGFSIAPKPTNELRDKLDVDL